MPEKLTDADIAQAITDCANIAANGRDDIAKLYSRLLAERVEMVEEIERLQARLVDVLAASQEQSILLTKINNLVSSHWPRMRELMGDCQTWEKCWEQRKAAEAGGESDGR